MTEEKESLRNSADSMADLCLRQSRTNSSRSQGNAIYSPGLCLITPAQAKVATTCVTPAQTCLLLATPLKAEATWLDEWGLSSWKPVLCSREKFGEKRECFWNEGCYKTGFIKYNERERLECEGKDWIPSTKQQWLLSCCMDGFTKFTCNKDDGLVRM